MKELALLITSLTTILSSIFVTFKFFHKILNRIDEINDQLKSDRMYIYKLAVFSDKLPIVDRIQAGNLYVKNGGNSSTKIMYEILLEKYSKEVLKDE